ncbi:DinB family protein [Nonomuraea sp. NPDC050783]|uniref:DinB family protein n=1 Tax=Nonomuraea sp. NPDC050783 TaxID=3154634 RepID=UPI003467E5BA
MAPSVVPDPLDTTTEDEIMAHETTTQTTTQTTTGTTARTTGAPALTGERADLLAVLAKQRHYLRFTTRDLTDEQAARRTTASELCLGGLIKHVTATERNWADFIVKGPSAMGDFTAMSEAAQAEYADGFRMLPGETLAGLLDAYAEVARRTDELVAGLPDLDADQPLPRAPWFPEGERWSARRVLMHILAETAQHAGHADIIRESLDGAKSMG